MFKVIWIEDSTPSVLGRISAKDGTGTATGVDGEGNWLKQADISTITCKIFDLDGATSGTAVATPTVTVSSAVLDTPVTSAANWTEDTTGYNFIHSLPETAFATGGHRMAVEYKVTLTGGAVFFGVYEGVIESIMTS